MYNWAEAIRAPFIQVWNQMALFVPKLLGALLVFILGLIVATVLAHLVERVLIMSRIDPLFAKTGIPKEFERSGVHFSLSRFFGRLTYWFFLVVTVLFVANILLGAGNNVFSILDPVLSYIPDVVKAVLILVGTFILANFIRHIVRASVVGAQLHSSKFLGTAAWWAIVIFGFVAALFQLGIGEEMLKIVGWGIIGMFALAGGLAFGLGGKEYASHLLGKFRDTVENKIQ